MIVFKDRTWCNTRCDNMGCSLNLTDEKLEEENRWRGNDNPPIAFAEYKDTEMCPGYLQGVKETTDEL